MVGRRAAKQAASIAEQLSSQATTLSSLGAKNTSRVQIISPSLCDDVLQRLASTLPPPNTCDLVDINPGTCLWSEKLHSVLQPRRHVLVESDEKRFGSFVNSLIQREPSKFSHTTSLQKALDAKNKYLSQDILDRAAYLSPESQTNSSLLLSVNLSGTVVRGRRFESTPAAAFFNDLYASVFATGNRIHRYGLIRILAWLPDHAKHAFIPRTTARRSKQSIQLEASASVEEVAGGPENITIATRIRRRWSDLEIEDHFEVAKREKDAGLKIPIERRHTRPFPKLESIPNVTIDILRKGQFASDSITLQDLLLLDARLRATEPQWYKNARENDVESHRAETEDQREWRRAFTVFRTRHKRFSHMAAVVQKQRDLEQKSRALIASNDPASVHDERIKAIKTDSAVVRDEMDNMSRDNRVMGRKAIDDYRAYDIVPRTLAWNHRPGEPLLVHEDEFAPHRPLALLDVKPNPHLLQILDTTDKSLCFEYVLTRLCSQPSSSVEEALQMMLQAGVDEFIADIPGLRDPRRGGWHDLSALRVRSLSMTLIMDIALAYEKWPFRHSTTELLMMRGRENGDVYRV